MRYEMNYRFVKKDSNQFEFVTYMDNLDDLSECELGFILTILADIYHKC